jgi:hypothetical protein
MARTAYLLFLVHAKNEHWHLGSFCFDELDQLKATAAWHGDIQDRQAPITVTYELKRLIAIAGLTDHTQVIRVCQYFFNAITNDGVIIGDQYVVSHSCVS